MGKAIKFMSPTIATTPLPAGYFVGRQDPSMGGCADIGGPNTDERLAAVIVWGQRSWPP